MQAILETKRREARLGIGFQPVVAQNGLIDTTECMLLTSSEALELAREKAVSDAAKRAVAAAKKYAAAEKDAWRIEGVRGERIRATKAAMLFRLRAYGDQQVLPRSVAVRRAVERRRHTMRMSMK